MTDGLTLGVFALWELIPFGVDTWPDCYPWERAGRATRWDREAIAALGDAAERNLRLEIDRRFDALDDWLEEQMAPRLEG